MLIMTSYHSRPASASLFPSLLLASLVMCSTAFRRRVSEEASHNMSAEAQTHEWQKKTYLFCLSTEQVIECDGEKEKMEVSTAMYNRNQKLRKEVCGAELGSKWRSCDVDAKEMVIYRCEGTQKCHLKPTDHAHCAERAFYQMRLVIKCSAGEPRPEPPRANCPHEQDRPCIEGVATTATPEPDPVKLAGYAAYLPESAQQYLPDAAKHLLNSAQQATTTEEPVVIENIAAMKVVKAKVIKEIENPHLEHLSLVPCYRFTRTGKLMNGEIFGNWAEWEILARLTNCGTHEGCFHLTFPDGSAHVDQNVPPTAQELAQGDLTEEKDSLWVTFRGTGLKRNDYGTWGVCMPKTKDLHYATTLWEAMRNGKVTGKLED